ncbi:steroid monooxygenase [Aspergillus spinulosporus]
MGKDHNTIMILEWSFWGQTGRSRDNVPCPLLTYSAGGGRRAIIHGWASDNLAAVDSRDGYRVRETPMGIRRPIRVIFMGMGAAGIAFAHSVLQMHDIDLTVYEKNPDIGGTWYENRYPGCACDVPSVNYQFSWHRVDTWSQYYVGSLEIHRFVKLNHRIIGAEWLENLSRWRITVMRNENPQDCFDDYAEFFLNGSGHFNSWRWPDIPGLETFKGQRIHSANWPVDDDVDLNNKRVLIIPTIISRVQHLHVVARSPTWVTAGGAPRYAGTDGANFQYSEETKRKFRDDPELYLRYMKAIESELNVRFKFVINGSREAKEAREYSETIMRQKLAKKPELIDLLMPKNFGIGCRRPLPGNGFLEALCEDKTSVYQRAQDITSTGFTAADGQHHEVDVIICATGFDTSFCPRFPIIANGRNVQDDFIQADGDIAAYLGCNLPEVPNYFMFSAPYGPLRHGSAIPMIEAFSKYIMQIIQKFQSEDICKIQVKRQAALDFTEHADLFLQRTAWSGPCSSTFKNGIASRKPLLWPGSRIHYLTMMQSPRYEDYDIEYLTRNRFNFMGNGFDVREHDGRDLTWYYGLVNGEDKQPAEFMDPLY